MLKAEFAVADAYFLFVVSSLPMKRLWTVQRDLVVAVHGEHRFWNRRETVLYRFCIYSKKEQIL